MNLLEILTGPYSETLRCFVVSFSAMKKTSSYNPDGLVNRLRIGSARLALGVRDSPAIYVVFDMLAIPKTCLVRLSVCAGKLSNDSD
jgi:hypothetical protein